MLTCNIWFLKSFQNLEYLYDKLEHYQDVEVLHQYRVTLRKLYAINKLFLSRGLIYQERAKKLQKQLKRLIKPTNVLRDYDIFLIELEDSELSDDLRMKLKKALNEDRELVLEQTLQETNSQNYKDDLYDLLKNRRKDEFFLLEFCNLQASDIKININKFEVEAIEYLNILNEHSDPHEFHQLRKKFKIIRYILSAFYDTFHEDYDSKEKIKELKNIQDALGAIQDSTMILHYLQHLMLDFDECDQAAIKSHFEAKYLRSVDYILEIKSSVKNGILNL